MSRWLLPLFSIVTGSLLISSCGDDARITASSTGKQESAIINGEKCALREHESALEIVIEAEIDFGILGLSYITNARCGATLIAPDVLLTAAHCLDTSDVSLGIGRILNLSYYVTWDDDLTYLDDSKTPLIPKNAVKASAWIREPAFDASKDQNGLGNYRDVALMFLEKPLPFKPAMLITKTEAEQIQRGKEATIAGWGQRTTMTMPILNAVVPRQSGVKFCATTTINEVGPYEMQIGSDDKTPRKCLGDSGGPTYLDILTPLGVQPRLVGITSHAYDEQLCFKGGIDTRVDAWLDWIDSTMRRGCETGIRVWCEVDGVILPPYDLFMRFLKSIFGWLP